MKKLLFTFLIIFALTACNPTPSHVKNSPNYINGEFANAVAPITEKSFWSFLTYRWKVDKGEWPEWIENTATPNLQKNKNEIVFTFINHATFLVEIGNKKILFDPMLSKTAGPTSWLGVKRRRPPAITMDDMPPIDYIFISHNHYEHLDVPTLKFLSDKFQPQIFVPLGDKHWLERKGIKNISEMDWWQVANSDDFTINFVPVQHWSKRSLFNTNQSLWGGYVLQHKDITLFHSGDTGYAPHFKAIGKKFNIDIAMLGIGSYKPDWFMEYAHMNPSQAVQAHIDLGASRSFGMHSETFPLTATDFGEAERDLAIALQDIALQDIALQDYPNINFTKLKVGMSVRYQR